MTASGPSSLRRVPGDDLAKDVGASRGLRRWWNRWRLVPLILLLLCVIAAVVIGAIARAELEEAATVPTGPSDAAVGGLPEGCNPAQPALAAEQPWLGDARAASENAFRANIADAVDSPYVEGREGWVYWNDLQAKNFSQALGRRVLSPDELAAWYASMDSLRDRLAEEGIDFVIQIAPAKWSVYPEYLPEWTEGLRGATSFDYVRTVHPDLPVLDMREALRDSKSGGNPYVPLNSHWTKYGGSIGWNQLAACLPKVDAERYAGLAPLEIASVQPQAEANEFEPFGFTTDELRDTSPVWATAPSPMTVEYEDGETQQITTDSSTDMTRLPAHTVTEAPQSQATALIMRDSQGANIDPGWQAGFAETWQVRHDLDSPDDPVNVLDIALEHHPDVVVFEMTERYLNFVPKIVY